MNIRAINAEQGYKDALIRPEVIFDAPIDTPESDGLDIFGALIDEYEKIYFPMDSN